MTEVETIESLRLKMNEVELIPDFEYVLHLINILDETGNYPSTPTIKDKVNDIKYLDELQKNYGYIIYLLENACKDNQIDIISIKRDYKIKSING
jgi:hypothetical protein